ncbi:MAG: N-acetylmuramoyl-L-alanine amidase [Fibrobacter sp.]|jgi:N-acetylmuramoyl-L-alanine amidase|nr:N-acetylmuramoyl-L-alanine amidase [Fibrobacter sp.]
MVDIETLARSENLNPDFHPAEKHFKAKGEKLECSFVLGLPYLYANGKASALPAPTRFEDGTVWAPAKETLAIFENALSKKFVSDTLLKKVSAVNAPAAPAPEVKPSVTPAAPPKTENKPAKKETAGTREVRTIIIDPGHGGKDPGALGKNSQEKDIVLAVANLLSKELRKQGFQVKLSRDTDKFIQLSERAELANKWDGDLFISLHCNAVDGAERQKKAKGYKFYVLRDPESEEDRAIARRENKVITEFGDKSSKAEISPLDWFVLEARLEKFKQNSYQFTEALLTSFKAGKIEQQGSGAGGAGFMVLVGAMMPAVLVELGFITHPEDEKYMASAAGQQDLAMRIAKAVAEYKKAVNEYRKTLGYAL